MKDSRAAIRYAKAALALAGDAKATEAVEKDMLSIIASIEASEELSDLLESPTVASTDKQKALRAIFKSAHQITLDLIDVLILNKRISMLSQAATAFVSLSESQKDEVVVDVVAASPLSKELENEIIAKMKSITAKNVSLAVSIDDSLIGGFVLRVGDLQYNASIAHQLNQLKRELTA
jgi:F-type H+-transporting ATPase subunit delta